MPCGDGGEEEAEKAHYPGCGPPQLVAPGHPPKARKQEGKGAVGACRVRRPLPLQVLPIFLEVCCCCNCGDERATKRGHQRGGGRSSAVGSCGRWGGAPSSWHISDPLCSGGGGGGGC